MEALQILNTLCTLPLEKMNTFLLTCLYLSFTVCTRIPYIPHPRQPPPCNANRLHFYNINCILFLNPQLNFQKNKKESAIRQYNLCRSDYKTWFCERFTLTVTHCVRDGERPHAAVHCLRHTYRQTQTTSDPSAVSSAGDQFLTIWSIFGSSKISKHGGNFLSNNILSNH